VFIYYSNHGAPGLKDRKGYFVPVEADPQCLELSGYPLDVLYENLAHLPSRSITVVLDACFSGSTVYENISPLVLEVKDPVIRAGNMVLLASASGSQASSWYHEKNHSMFT
jgi:Caspase domain